MNMANNYTNDNYYKAQNNDFIKKISVTISILI